MARNAYRLVESVAGFTEGEILDETARFGDWHVYDVRLEPRIDLTNEALELTADELDTVAEPVEQTA